MNGKSRDTNVVQRPDEQLEEVKWPHIEEFEVSSFSSGDVLVLCGGFEERVMGLLELLVGAGKTDLKVVLVEYLPRYEENKISQLQALADRAGIRVEQYVYDRQSPAGGGEDVAELVKLAKHVYVDISGMSRLLIVQVIVALLQRKLPLTIAYAEAEKYPPTKEDFEREFSSSVGETTLDFLSSGVFEVAATPELGSVAMVGEAIRLVVFPSLEAVQMKNLLQEVQPTYIDLVYGVPPATENRWRRSAAQRLNEGVLRGQTGTSEHRASTLDYRETIEVLIEIYGQRSMFDRILVAPIGSKMQAVAVGVVRAVLTDLQIVYPTPQDLKADNYTEGLRRIYQLRMPSIVA